MHSGLSKGINQPVGLVEPCEELVTAVHKAEGAFRVNQDSLKCKSKVCQLCLLQHFQTEISAFLNDDMSNMP